MPYYENCSAAALLLKALKLQDHELLLTLLQAGANLLLPIQNGKNFLCLARAQKGWPFLLYTVQVSLNQFLDQFKGHEADAPPPVVVLEIIHRALAADKFEIIETARGWLEERVPELWSQWVQLWNLLEVIINMGKETALDAILQHNPELLQGDPRSPEKAPLLIALNQGQWECVTCIVRHWPKPQSFGADAVQYSVFAQQLQNALQALIILSAKTKINVAEIGDLLCQAGVDLIWQEPTTQNTFLHFAIQQHDRTAVEWLTPKFVQLWVLQQSVDCASRNAEGKTPLQLALELEFWDCIECMSRTPDIFKADVAGFQAILTRVISHNMLNRAQLLLRAVSVLPSCLESSDARDHESWVHIAVRNGNPGMVALLTAKGADLGALNSLDETPLELAARLERWDLVLVMAQNSEARDFPFTASEISAFTCILSIAPLQPINFQITISVALKDLLPFATAELAGVPSAQSPKAGVGDLFRVKARAVEDKKLLDVQAQGPGNY